MEVRDDVALRLVRALQGLHLVHLPSHNRREYATRFVYYVREHPPSISTLESEHTQSQIVGSYVLPSATWQYCYKNNPACPLSQQTTTTSTTTVSTVSFTVPDATTEPVTTVARAGG